MDRPIFQAGVVASQVGVVALVAVEPVEDGEVV